jgi:P-type E1-E2 ATPase
VIVTRQDEDGNQIEKTVHSSKLVPGDIMQITSIVRMPVDALLLSGSVIVNEGVLTGESVPLIKTELPHSNYDVYDPVKDKKYTIYAGTEILKKK